MLVCTTWRRVCCSKPVLPDCTPTAQVPTQPGSGEWLGVGETERSDGAAAGCSPEAHADNASTITRATLVVRI
ncbi:hypothetical protein Adu01nite_25560 [Paractinoplanes durhamensis]|uniref:Uncharacterized protein n=1 Tax=Paractinoplanes durhamensis TaxID=113563 RepID=A0ABQ3YUH1_9ACTN|nr:hypothetical protein Adu01nite_25560 [Actinoplanes durhamensis]